jgi:hypothetical protein
MYQKKYSFDQAEKMGVIIKPSIHKNKKIDVFDKNNKFIVSIGHIAYAHPTPKTNFTNFSKKF